MSAEPAYRIDVQDQDVIVRLRSDLLNREEIERFLDYLELESIRRRSELTEEQAAALAEEIDEAVWERFRGRASESVR